MEKTQESINKDLEELKNKHTVTKQLLKLKILNIRIYEAEEQISELEDKIVEMTSEVHNRLKKNKRKELRIVLETCGTISNAATFKF